MSPDSIFLLILQRSKNNDFFYDIECIWLYKKNREQLHSRSRTFNQNLNYEKKFLFFFLEAKILQER